MTHADVMQVCDADMRIKVYSVVPGFEGKGDRMTVQDAINYEMADRYGIKESFEEGACKNCGKVLMISNPACGNHVAHKSMELASDLEEKYAHEAWMAQA